MGEKIVKRITDGINHLHMQCLRKGRADADGRGNSCGNKRYGSNFKGGNSH